MRLSQPRLQRRQQSPLVGVERKREPPPRPHDVAGQLRLFGAGRREQDRVRIAVQHPGHVDQIDRLVVDLAFAHLDETIDEAAKPEALRVGSTHEASFGVAGMITLGENRHGCLAHIPAGLN